MTRFRSFAWALAGALALAAASIPAQAQPHRHGPYRGDIARFHEHDWAVWRGGRWQHARHGGRLGWWWVVGGVWYFYPAPVYPYPNPYEPPPAVVVAPPADAPPPPTQFWYYYPYAPSCAGGWRQVPATPPVPEAPRR
jgi:hypothetical protein